MAEGVYSAKKIATGVFLGGPIAGGYYFWRTFKTLGLPKHASLAIVATGLVLLLICASLFLPAQLDQTVNFLFWGLEVGVTYGVYRAYLSDPVAKYFARRGHLYGWGNTLLVALMSLVLTLSVTMSILYATGAFDAPSVRYYGVLRHEIAYESSNITTAEVDKIGGALRSSGFFDDEVQKTVDATKDGNRYVINIYCNETARDPDAIAMFRELRSNVQKSFPGNPVIFDLVIGTPDNRITRLE